MRFRGFGLMPSKYGICRVSKVRLVLDRGNYWPDDPLVAEATARIKPRK
jgi:hypothetical protein